MRTGELRLLLSRIRWVNLAGLVGLPALALAIVLWPRLAPSPSLSRGFAVKRSRCRACAGQLSQRCSVAARSGSGPQQ